MTTSAPIARTHCGSAEHLSQKFDKSLAQRGAAKAQGLGVAAGGGYGSDKHGIEAIHRAIFSFLTAQPERIKALCNAHVDAEAVGLHPSVDLTSFVADGDAVSVTAVPWTGMFFYGGKHFLVNEKRVYPLDALCFHGVVSPLDLAWFTSIEQALTVALTHAGQHQDLQYSV